MLDHLSLLHFTTYMLAVIRLTMVVIIRILMMWHLCLFKVVLVNLILLRCICCCYYYCFLL